MVRVRIGDTSSHSKASSEVKRLHYSRSLQQIVAVIDSIHHKYFNACDEKERKSKDMPEIFWKIFARHTRSYKYYGKMDKYNGHSDGEAIYTFKAFDASRSHLWIERDGTGHFIDLTEIFADHS